MKKENQIELLEISEEESSEVNWSLGVNVRCALCDQMFFASKETLLKGFTDADNQEPDVSSYHLSVTASVFAEGILAGHVEDCKRNTLPSQR